MKKSKKITSLYDQSFVLASDVSKVVLDNGLTILVKEAYPAKVTSLSFWFRVGSVYEKDESAGISHFLEHMLFKRTKKRAPGEIAREVNALGGYLNAFTSYDHTCFWMVLPSDYFKLALEIQSDAVLNPLFASSDINKERQVIAEEIKMYQDQPEKFLQDKLMELAFKKHPYRRPIIGFEETLLKINKFSLERFYNKFYHPNNLIIAVVGNLDTSETIKEIKRIFGSLDKKHIFSYEKKIEPVQHNFRVEEYYGDIKNTHLQLGFRIPSVYHDDTYSLNLLSSVLGEGLSSRLNINLKEKRALVADISAYTLSERDAGLFVIEAVLEKKNYKKARRCIFDEIDKICSKNISLSELQKAKNMIICEYIFTQEVVEGQGKKLGYYETLGDYTLADKFLQQILDVSVSDVQRAANKYLSYNNCSLVSYFPKE